jgi:hypothetical protein
MRDLHREDFTPDFSAALIKEYGTLSNAANKVMAVCVTTAGTPAGRSTVRGWIKEAIEPTVLGREDVSRSSRIETLMEEVNVPLEAVGTISKIKHNQREYQVKGEKGVLNTTEIVYTPTTPLFPVADRATPNVIQFTDAPRLLRQTRQIVVVSDAQLGYLQDPESHELDPIHDPEAMRVAELITAAVQPSELFFIGDWLDLSFASRYDMHPEFDAVNPSIQAGYEWLCRFIAAAGPQVTKKVMIGSNHDLRLETMMLKYNKAAMRIRDPRKPEGWPVFSVPYLLHFEEHGVEFSGQFPGGEYYILPDLLAMHAPPKAAEFQASVIHGHTHKISTTPRVQHSSEGRKTYYTYDIGCLCQLGVTNNEKRLMVTKVPSDQGRTNWQNGFAVVNVVDGKFPLHTVDQIRIQDGQALYQNEVFSAD